MNKKTEVRELYDTVIKGDYCIGCGACSFVENSPFKMGLDEFGNYKAYLDPVYLDVSNNLQLLNVCPFSGKSKNEDELGEIFFPSNKKDNYIGNYLNCYAGFVKDDKFRSRGSSGGLAKWLGAKLLETDEIDNFIQVTANQTNNPSNLLFDYVIHNNSEDVLKGSKSSYYPTTLEAILKYVNENDGSYAITGTPCFIKTLRLLSLKNPLINKRIRFTFGIVCGGMKSANHSKMVGWQLGVHPDNLTAIDFRRKFKDRPANHKIYQVWTDRDKEERFEDSSKIIGTDYGAGFFKPNPCDYCDDVVAETADISFGDAWLPQYTKDPKGTSLVIVRNKILNKILTNYRGKDIALDDLSKDDVIKSQAGGFRHRREALSFRIHNKDKSKIWYPKKRVEPRQFKISNKRKKLYSIREELAKESHVVFLKALKENDLAIFTTKMASLMELYKKAKKKSYYERILKKLKSISALKTD